MCNKNPETLFQFIVIVLGFLLFLFSCTSRDHKQSTKFDQYYVQGKALYEINCGNCHQKTGIGLRLLYPPINKSDFMDANFGEVICLIKNGREGELLVNGRRYNKPMKGIVSLTELEIAEITTYIYNTWDHHRGIVEVQEVSTLLSTCKTE